MKKRKVRSKYRVALKIVTQEAKKRRSLKPFKLLWKKVTYGEKYPFMLRATLPEYVDFCRVNGIMIVIPEEELA